MAWWLVSPPTPPMASSIFIRWKDAKAGEARSSIATLHSNSRERRFRMTATLLNARMCPRDGRGRGWRSAKPGATRLSTRSCLPVSYWKVPVDVDDQVDGRFRGLPCEGGQRAASVERDDGVVGPGPPRHVVDARDVGGRAGRTAGGCRLAPAGCPDQRASGAGRQAGQIAP